MSIEMSVSEVAELMSIEMSVSEVAELMSNVWLVR
jgi:hypothetical protein